MADNVRYPEKWRPIEFTCECGVKCRVDVEVILGPRQGEPPYRHCSRGKDQPLTGRIIAIWEDGACVRT